jgi:putative PIN family toxin of toxin-antitoxin system
MVILVIDTNILVGALLKNGGTARQIIRACLTGKYQPLIGPALISEYEDVLGRDEVMQVSALNKQERYQLFDGFLNCCRWVEVYYAWRPNLPDEADNHLIELAIAGQASAIVTRNVRDIKRGELKFPALGVLTPNQCLEVFPCQP